MIAFALAEKPGDGTITTLSETGITHDYPLAPMLILQPTRSKYDVDPARCEEPTSS